MVDERYGLTVRRNAKIADPSGCLPERLSDRVLDPRLRPDSAYDRERLTVRRPVGELDVLLNLARRSAARDPDARERAGALEGSHEVAIQAHGHLSGARDRQHVGALEPEGPGLGTLEPADEDLDRPAFPGRGVDDGLPVGSESRGEDLSPLERQLPK